MNTDVLFLDSLRRMDEVALIQVFDEYAFAIHKYTMRMCNNPVLADNIVGDVFFSLLNQLSCGSGPRSNLRSYLFESAYHLLVDQVRHTRRQISLETPGVYLTENDVIDQDTEQRILYDGVWHIIQTELTDYQRQVIILRFLDGFSLQETAEILGKSANVIKAAQNRAVKILRRSLCQWMTI